MFENEGGNQGLLRPAIETASFTLDRQPALAGQS